MTASSGAVVLWDVTDPAHPVQTARLLAGGVWVRAVAFSPDGRVLASGKGATVNLWDVTDPVHPAAAAALIGHGGEVLGWRSARTGSCWPAAVPTRRFGCGRWADAWEGGQPGVAG